MRGLPPGSALHRAANPRGWNWNNNEELLAGILERVDWANILYLGAHGVEEARLPKLTRVDRPWEPEKALEQGHRQSTTEELKRFFGGGQVKVVERSEESE